jgi:hypothetical protein
VNVAGILYVIALVLAIVDLFGVAAPLTTIAVILVCAGLLSGALIH